MKNTSVVHSSPTLTLATTRKNVAVYALIALLATVPLQAQATDVSVTLAAARQAAHENHNAESARLYEMALATAPEMRLEIIPELSDQLTYSGHAAQAIPLYQQALASNQLAPDAERHAELGLALAYSWDHRLKQSLATYALLVERNPRDTEALLGHARVLSWQNQLTPSLHEYEHILALDPNNLEATENIARVQSWRGRQHEAKSDAQAILAQHPSDLPAFVTLADADLWMGRPDEAQRDDAAILHAHPTDTSALGLASDISDAQKVQSNFAVSTASSSDGLNIRTDLFQATVPIFDARSSLGVVFQPITYIGQDATASERRSGFFAQSRLNDWSEIHASLATDDISASGTPNKSLFLYNAYLTIWPNDTFRFDIGSRQETYDNIISLQKGIYANFDTFSMDVTPNENERFTLRANQASLSDGNRRGWEQLDFEQTVDREPHLSFGLEGTSYSFSQTLNNGYFDPPRYQSAAVTTHIYWNVHGRVYYDASGAYGREWVVNGGTRPTYAAHGAISYVASRALTLSAVYDSFDTRQTQSGFARTTFGLNLQTKW